MERAIIRVFTSEGAFIGAVTSPVASKEALQDETLRVRADASALLRCACYAYGVLQGHR